MIHRQTEFISPAYYTSMGFARAGGLGGDGGPAQPAARGVGGRRGLPDDRHGTIDDRPPPASTRSSSCWTTRATAPNGSSTPAITSSTTSSRGITHKVPEVLGGGRGYEIRTEGRVRRRPCNPPWPTQTQMQPAPRPSRPARLQRDAGAPHGKAADAGVGFGPLSLWERVRVRAVFGPLSRPTFGRCPEKDSVSATRWATCEA